MDSIGPAAALIDRIVAFLHSVGIDARRSGPRRILSSGVYPGIAGLEAFGMALPPPRRANGEWPGIPA